MRTSYVFVLFDDALVFVRFLQEELRVEVGLGDGFMVDDRERADACQDQILRHFVRERFHCDEQDVCGSDPESC